MAQTAIIHIVQFRQQKLELASKSHLRILLPNYTSRRVVIVSPEIRPSSCYDLVPPSSLYRLRVKEQPPQREEWSESAAQKWRESAAQKCGA